VSALRDDDVGVALARFDEFEVHRFDRAEILFDDRLNGPAALGDVALQTPDEARVVVCIHEYLDVHQLAEIGIGVDQNPLDNQRTARRDDFGFVLSRVAGEIIDGRLH
jgi:hypothetical protein